MFFMYVYLNVSIKCLVVVNDMCVAFNKVQLTVMLEIVRFVIFYLWIIIFIVLPVRSEEDC